MELWVNNCNLNLQRLLRNVILYWRWLDAHDITTENVFLAFLEKFLKSFCFSSLLCV